MTPKGSLDVTPDSGLQMKPIWMPSPEAVVGQAIDILTLKAAGWLVPWEGRS